MSIKYSQSWVFMRLVGKKHGIYKCWMLFFLHIMGLYSYNLYKSWEDGGVFRLTKQSSVRKHAHQLYLGKKLGLALHVARLKPSLTGADNITLFLKPHAALSIDTGVKIESGAAAWNGSKCRTDGRTLYLEGTQSQKEPRDIFSIPSWMQFHCPDILTDFWGQNWVWGESLCALCEQKCKKTVKNIFMLFSQLMLFFFVLIKDTQN